MRNGNSDVGLVIMDRIAIAILSCTKLNFENFANVALSID